jgi:drug/metabolite transporter (DMT)-like permease
VILGLSSAVVWGAADFGGGLMSRRTAVFGVVLVSQLAGLAIALALTVARAEPFPGPMDVGWSLLAGILGGIGITALYRGLAVGRMAIVAPIIGVLAAVIPVVAGIVLEGVPPPLVLVGIALAVSAVLLVSRVADEGGGRAGLREALVAGVTIGLFGVVIAQISDGAVFGPMSLIRTTQAILIAVLIVVTRSAWRPPSRLIPILAVIGILDMSGNVTYLLAVQTGLLAVASVLSALYPVVTVLLAAVVLGERITREHAVGILLAASAIVCIGLGSA